MLITLYTSVMEVLKYFEETVVYLISVKQADGLQLDMRKHNFVHCNRNQLFLGNEALEIRFAKLDD